MRYVRPTLTRATKLLIMVVSGLLSGNEMPDSLNARTQGGFATGIPRFRWWHPT